MILQLQSWFFTTIVGWLTIKQIKYWSLIRAFRYGVALQYYGIVKIRMNSVHRAVTSTASTTRTRTRRLTADSAPARRCSFPRWCKVPLACCSKTAETSLDTVFAVLPLAKRKFTWLRTSRGCHCSPMDRREPWISQNVLSTARPLTIFLKPANISKFVVKGIIYVTCRSDLREFSFGIPVRLKRKERNKKDRPVEIKSWNNFEHSKTLMIT